MFETVIPETVVRPSRRIFYETLPVSIALHVVVVIGCIIGYSWKVAFPTHSPLLLRPYSLVEAPPPPPPPPPPPAAPKQIVVPVSAPVQTTEIVAPTIIPDVIPLVTQSLPQPTTTVAGVVGGVEGGISGGTVGGSTSGETGGTLGGVVGGTLGGIVTDNRVHIERDKPLPLHPLSQVYPIYPRDAWLRGLEDSLVVRYVIGKDGRIKEVSVVVHATEKVFEEAAVKAIRTWRFRPLMKDGQPTEVVHELTVNFKLERT